MAAKVDVYFEEVIDQIAINPNLFPYSDKKKNLIRCVISPQTTLYYRFNGEYVELVSFRGNKMNPETLGLQNPTREGLAALIFLQLVASLSLKHKNRIPSYRSMSNN